MAIAANNYSQGLKSLLTGISAVDDLHDCMISGLALDSRQVKRGDLFLALPGTAKNGLQFAGQAVENGAVAVLCEADQVQQIIGQNVPVIGVHHLAEQLGIIAARFYEQPSARQFVVGVTGTNGKTSCSHFFAQALDKLGQTCGVLGTLGYGVYKHHGEGLLQARLTTPDAIQVQALLAQMLVHGVTNVVLEASSHGLDQGRLNGVCFDVAVLTNLSHDHLDYHGDYAQYAAAKRRLFAMPGLRYAVINGDDIFGQELLQQLAGDVEVISYGLHAAADIKGEIKRLDQSGMELDVVTPWGQGRLCSKLLGQFNASNLLAIMSVLLLHGVSLDAVLDSLSQVHTVAGRMEGMGGDGGRPLVVIDYAHTPDALQQVLQTLRQQCRGQLWCVFGCGGDRDKNKRPIMGGIATASADHVVVTDDNPRTEPGEQIVADILAGISQPAKVQVIRDRGEAIAYAIRHAAANDVVLVAGKGHEAYQLIGELILPFSDRQYVKDVLMEVA